MNYKEDFKIFPERFHPWVTVIKESKDLDNICVRELVGSLQNYDSTLSYQKKCKFIVLISIKKEHDYSSNDDFNSEDIANANVFSTTSFVLISTIIALEVFLKLFIHKSRV